MSPCKQTEAQIQRAVWEYFQRFGRKGVRGFHIPNGGRRGIVEAVNFKRMGVVPGLPDLMFFRPAIVGLDVFSLELKAPKGRPTEAQMEWRDWIKNHGGYAAVADGVDEAIKVLKAWELVK